jgi:hypothetical protein
VAATAAAGHRSGVQHVVHRAAHDGVALVGQGDAFQAEVVDVKPERPEERAMWVSQ